MDHQFSAALCGIIFGAAVSLLWAMESFSQGRPM